MDGMTAPALRSMVLSVNGESRTLLVEPRTHLADALREQLNLTGTHLGCEQGVCGACTVLIDGIPQRACIAYALDCEGSRITTIEGFDGDPTMAALREAFSARHALQCGFCTPGMLVTSRDIVLRLGDVPEARIREELGGNLCRCTGYVGIVDAVRDVAAGRAPQPAQATAPVAQRVENAAAPEPAAKPIAAAPATAPGGAVLEERVHLAATPEAVWAALSDLRRVASCLPGARLDTLEGERVTGRVTMALGPIKASFAGDGRVVLDDAARSGRLLGGGRDGASRAEGEVGWHVVPANSGGSDILVSLSWRLTGPLAQFGRGALVKDLVRRLAQDFARNLDAMVAGAAPPPARPVGVLGLLWAALKARLFGR
jgi:aerobic-type carbon monoxide dehydrogenase small subunit (CoxS/CutS family)/carbon monoxide dehydrogenase subunit G